MDTISLKKYIYDNHKIELILESIGCKNIKYHDLKEFYSCSNKDGDNVGAINVKNNAYLNVVNWTRQKDFGENSDIITLVEYNQKISFIEAVKYIHKVLGLSYQWQKPQQTTVVNNNPLDIFEKHRGKRKIDVSELQVLSEDILADYVPLLHIKWLKEGVMPWTAKKFGLAYSYKRNRIILPMRYWLTGELLGINSRTTVDNYNEFGIKKFYITPSYKKSLNLFGLYENYKSIKEAGYVVVYEAEKSVLKRDSLNDSTGVALSGHTISDEQVSILFGLNVDIIIAMDKDIPIEEIRNMCEKFYNKRNVYYIYDKWDLLKDKDSPADAKNKIYDFLMKFKVKYDYEEHKQYLKSLGRK